MNLVTKLGARVLFAPVAQRFQDWVGRHLSRDLAMHIFRLRVHWAARRGLVEDAKVVEREA